MEFILSQLFGFIALILSCIGYFFKHKTQFLIIQIFSNIFYASAYLVVGTMAGGVLTLISVIRCIIFYFIEKKDLKHSVFVLPILILIYILLGLYFYSSPADLIPIFTSSIFTIAFYIKDLQKTRLISIIPNFLLIIYNLYSKTYTSALLDIIEIIILVVSITKYRKKKVSKSEI